MDTRSPTETGDKDILVIGAGTWGLAVAYRLAKKGYRKITVLDPHEVPSYIAAGSDLNKILEEPEDPPNEGDDDETYAWSVIETTATQVWKEDSIYSPHYHQTGFIYAAVSEMAYKKVLESCGHRPDLYTPLPDAKAFRAAFPVGTVNGDLPGWRGFWRKKHAGWVAARQVLEDLHSATKSMGVEFIVGDHIGRVERLLYDVESNDVVGLLTADGTEHYADVVVLAAGASSDNLIDFQKQLRPTAWTLAHIPLSPEEAERYRDMPVLYGVDRGFFIEPNVEQRVMKICDEHPGYINLVLDKRFNERRSYPFTREQIPIEAANRMRSLLTETIPRLADRPFSFARICWDADTMDRIFLIDRHPQFPSLLLAVGGSGHGFMCSPAVGVLVADLMEGKLEEKVARALRWRPEQAVERDWYDPQNRFGAENKVMNLQDVDRWTSA